MAFLFCLASPETVLGEIITFDFEGTAGTDLDGLTSGTTVVTSGGITLTMTANTGLVSGSPVGSFNLTGTGFGINNTGSDDTDAFDADLGVVPLLIDTMEFTITSNVALQDLELVSLEFDRFTAGDEGGLLVDGNTVGSFGATFSDSELSGSNVLTVNETGLTAANTITLSFAAGNGFGLEFITFDATQAAAAVPEPGTVFATAMLCGVCLLRRNKKRKR